VRHVPTFMSIFQTCRSRYDLTLCCHYLSLTDCRKRVQTGALREFRSHLALATRPLSAVVVGAGERTFKAVESSSIRVRRKWPPVVGTFISISPTSCT
jgi:hypothetical protein